MVGPSTNIVRAAPDKKANHGISDGGMRGRAALSWQTMMKVALLPKKGHFKRFANYQTLNLNIILGRKQNKTYLNTFLIVLVLRTLQPDSPTSEMYHGNKI